LEKSGISLLKKKGERKKQAVSQRHGGEEGKEKKEGVPSPSIPAKEDSKKLSIREGGGSARLLKGKSGRKEKTGFT